MSSVSRTNVAPPVSSAPPAGAAPAAAPAEADLPMPMTEVDLLPAWYPALVRRPRWLTAQAWATGALLVVLTTVLLLRREDVAATRFELATLGDLRRETDATLAELAAQQTRLSALIDRAKVAAQIGLPLEVSRVLADVARDAPPDTALTDIDVRTEESPGKAGAAPGRAMKFVLKGIASNIREASQFEERLRANELLRNVRLAGAVEGRAYDRPVTAFEITFQVDLAAGDDAFAEARGGAR